MLAISIMGTSGDDRPNQTSRVANSPVSLVRLRQFGLHRASKMKQGFEDPERQQDQTQRALRLDNSVSTSYSFTATPGASLTASSSFVAFLLSNDTRDFFKFSLIVKGPGIPYAKSYRPASSSLVMVQ